QQTGWLEKQDAHWRPFLEHHKIKTIIDVGANEGQFAILMQRHFPDARILSFEPLEICQSKLSRVIANSPDSKIFKVAIGDETGFCLMNQSDFTPCSSLLSGSSLLGEDYDDATKITQIQVPISRLDDCLQEENLDPEILVKFDVQGFEIPAIRGAIKTLEKASIVVIETCFFRKLYQQQPLFHEIYTLMHDLGFSFMGNAEQYTRKKDGRIVEADSIFEKR
ncbi:MAG: FkbM family methyltransferase, partial [Sphaerospermopsis kisseleviana]